MKLFTMKMPEEEFEELRKEAHKHGKNKSEYIRWLIEKERGRKSESN